MSQLGVPLVWIGFVSGRGAIDGTYVSGFANVTEHGYGPVMVTFVYVMVFEVIVETFFWGSIGFSAAQTSQKRLRGEPFALGLV